MDRQTWLKYLFIFTMSTCLLYLMITKQNGNILKSFKFPLFKFSSNTDPLVPTTNESNESISVNISLVKEFQPKLSEYYPHLPIHIHTQDIPPFNNRTKLILLGNGFFGERNWGMKAVGKSSTELMTSLSCPFLSNYCDITTDMNRLNESDAVVYHIRDSIDQNFVNGKRRPHQRFVFALWESPAHTPDLRHYASFFNWTMSFRFKSDIITSYYSGNPYIHTSSRFYRMMMQENITRKLNLTTKSVDFRLSNETLAKKKLGIAAALVSNCGGSSKRLALINALNKYIPVEVYGRCGKGCPGNRNCREFIAENYFFIFSFENSLCQDYTTEKFFASLEFPVVPVVLGRTNYSAFIPSTGFIDASGFSSVLALAEFLNKTRYDYDQYLSYFAWKKDYVWGLSDFMTPFCDLCLRLHLDSRTNIIPDIQSWWFDQACQQPKLP